MILALFYSLKECWSNEKSQADVLFFFFARKVQKLYCVWMKVKDFVSLIAQQPTELQILVQFQAWKIMLEGSFVLHDYCHHLALALLIGIR